MEMMLGNCMTFVSTYANITERRRQFAYKYKEYSDAAAASPASSMLARWREHVPVLLSQFIVLDSRVEHVHVCVLM